ncbi:MAG: hypothetical protein ACK462_09135, partial [Planctomyces sp.]
VTLPPLRDRRDDIPRIVMNALARTGQKLLPGRPVPSITDAAMMRLTAYDWPGNVRQLLNVVQNMVVTAAADVVGINDPIQLDLRHIPDEIRTGDAPEENDSGDAAPGS